MKCLAPAQVEDMPGTATGRKVDLADRMRFFWQEIGFTPATFQLPNPEGSEGSKLEGDTGVSEDTSFRRQIDRPEMKDQDIKKVIGKQIRNFPPTITDEEVVKFLVEKVDKDITMERIGYMKNEQSVNAAIESGLEGAKVVTAFEEIEFRQPFLVNPYIVEF